MFIRNESVIFFETGK